MPRLRTVPVLVLAVLTVSTPALAEFSGDQRFDTAGGVPAYRKVSVTSAGAARFPDRR